MKAHHYLAAVVILIVGYALGVKFPQWAANIPGLGS
jgi:hypothetical protein